MPNPAAALASADPDRPARQTHRAHPQRRLALLGLAQALLLTQLPACAHDVRTRAQPVEMSVVDRESGQVLPVYQRDGRIFVAGRPAARYAIRLANQTGGRVLVVLSVDGVNVVSGQTAAWGQTGYVLDPWRSYDIAGWRKSDSAIAAFEFAALSDSYAARTGRPGNVGVIGMAVFLEKPAVELALPATPADRAGPARESAAAGEAANASPAAKAAAPRAEGSLADAARAAPPLRSALSGERLGTAHGQREWSVSSRTSFERLSSSPQAVVEIAYDSFANLVAAGVIPLPVAAQARAFPRNEDPRGFVPDPPAR